MKTKFIFFLSALFIGSSMFAQTTDCATTLSIFSSYAKNKNYKEAAPHYAKLIKDCPSYHLATYQYGARMLKHFLDEGDPAKKMENAKALIKNYKLRLQYFPEKTKKGETLANIAQVKYDNEIGTTAEQYAAFDEAWKVDKSSFQSPKALYTYFSLLVELHDAGKIELQDVFTKYDAVIAKIEELENKKAKVAAPLIEKQQAGTELTSKEKRILSNTEIYLSNYVKIKNGIKGKLGQRADCENLIPLYEGQFAERKDDLEWIKVATSMLSQKECTDSDLFVKLVEAQQRLEPSAKTALYLGMLAQKGGNTSKAIEYYKQSLELEKNASDKATLYYLIANVYKDQGRYASARSNYRKALDYKPSLGTAYLQIANMYASSANDCGDSVFEKLAVYWVAAEYAERAGRVDPSISSSANQAAAAYRARAPQKSQIFQSGKAGTTITIDCWIGESVRVPKL